MIKHFGHTLSKLKARYKILLYGCMCAILISIGVIPMVSYSESINTGLANSLIRLHVVANSDSEQDQALKLQVRDKIIEYMKTNLKNSETVNDVKFTISAKINEIREVAQQNVFENKKDYKVNVSLGNYAFPTKSYGDVILPAGNYEALRVIIGEGCGKNWWCVLFPPLCFVDATHGVVPESTKQELQKSLTSEEYELITSSKNPDKVPVHVKFKVVEILQKSKTKIQLAINKFINKT